MGRCSTLKEYYDRIAHTLLVTRGDLPHILNRTGRYPDLLVWSPRRERLGLVEVKSPNETDAWLSQCYKKHDYNLGDLPRSEHFKRLESFVNRKYRRHAHQVIVTITNQLYCYCWDLLQRSHLYRPFLDRIPGSRMPSRFDDIDAYLIVPLDWEKIAIVQIASEYLKSVFPELGLSRMDDPVLSLTVIQVSYPATPPKDLARSQGKPPK